MKTPMEKYLDQLIDGAVDDQKRDGVPTQILFRGAQTFLSGKMRGVGDGLYEMICLHQVDPKNKQAVVCLRHVFEASAVTQVVENAAEADHPKIVEPARGGLVIPS